MVFFFFDFAIFLCLFCKYFCCVGYEGSAHTNVFTNVTKLPTICYTIKLLRIGLDVNNCKRIFLDFFLAYCYASSDVLYHIYTTSKLHWPPQIFVYVVQILCKNFKCQCLIINESTLYCYFYRLYPHCRKDPK